MKKNAKELVEQLIAAFHATLGEFSTPKEANRAARKVGDIYIELRCLGEEGYAALDELLTHPNPLIRGGAAYWTYPRHPEKSIAILEEIRDNTPVGFMTGNCDAAVSLKLLEWGKFVDPIDQPKAKAKYEKAMAKLAAEGKK